MSKTLMEAPEISIAKTLPTGIADEHVPSQEWPEWFQKSQQEAWEEFQSLPYPARKDESWRFSNVKALSLDGYVPAQAVENAETIVKTSISGLKCAARFVFVNNRLVHKSSEALPEGVIIETLSDAAKKHPEIFRSYFMKQEVHLGSRKFAALHKAQLTGGVLVYLPDDTIVENPIEVFHWASGENASVFPHTLIILGRNSKASVVDHYGSVNNTKVFAAGVNDLHLREGADLAYIAVQEWSPASLAIHLNSTIVESNAVSRALQANLGGRFVRTESLSRMVGDSARSEMLSISPLANEQEIDQRTLQDHAHPNTASDLLYHNTLDDKARSVFAGLIRVEPHAHRTDAYQKVRNLLLSDEAEANSMPGLEIKADDVRCTHGATSGQIDDNEMFYMLQRGITPRDARRLLVLGFLRTVIERIPTPALQDYLVEKVEARLAQLQS